ncbi:MAG TPA: hypothetical protein VGF18_03330 [Candidatus Tumulicola sp.]
MALQNRVTPFGDIQALSGRGTLMGNRGVLHDEQRRLVRQWQLRRWIACRLEWRGIQRIVMSPRRYTELFFLDEAAAFAAGHRPCAECRNADYKRFQTFWQTCFGTRLGADAMDDVLHAERLDSRTKRTFRAPLSSLPNGVFIVGADGRPWVVWNEMLVAWTDAGYAERIARPKRSEVDVLTPPSIVRIIDAGLSPAVHPSLES